MSVEVTVAPRAAEVGRGHTIIRWLPPVALALLIGGGGLAKLAGDLPMVQLFADIGAGQWLRYLVGSLEVGGAIGLVVPRLAGSAALGIAALMVGAAVTNIAVLHTSPALPLALFVIAVAIGWTRREHLVPWR